METTIMSRQELRERSTMSATKRPSMPHDPQKSQGGGDGRRISVDISDVGTLKYIRDLTLELHKLADKTSAPHLAELLAAAAAEAHHQSQEREQ